MFRPPMELFSGKLPKDRNDNNESVRGPGRFAPGHFGPGRFAPTTFRSQYISSRDFLDLNVLLPDVSDQDVSPPNILNRTFCPLIIVILDKIYVSVESFVI